ncbi:MAG: hypothetical protein SXA11_06990 [Cyanobacteriota bacterium]|nr:hypothetical protein [Cyanobacteriota bacterium]
MHPTSVVTIAFLKSSNFLTTVSTADLLEEAVAIATAYGITAYDGSY